VQTVMCTRRRLSGRRHIEWGGDRRQGHVGSALVAASVVQEREGGGETLARYHARRNELHSILKGPKAKDIQVYITMRSLYKGQIRRRPIHIANTCTPCFIQFLAVF
jgi:hypothetical protein